MFSIILYGAFKCLEHLYAIISMWNLLAFMSREFPSTDDFKVYFWDTLLCIQIGEVFLLSSAFKRFHFSRSWFQVDGGFCNAVYLLFCKHIFKLHFGKTFSTNSKMFLFALQRNEFRQIRSKLSATLFQLGEWTFSSFILKRFFLRKNL